MSNYQAMKKQMCFRWHVSRIVGGSKSTQRDVHVTITPETAKFRDTLGKCFPKGIIDIQEDRLKWWHMNKYEFEGYTAEKELLNACIRQNVASDLKTHVYLSQERGLEEDMVLLQCVPNHSRTIFNECYILLNSQWKENGFPDVTNLVKIKEALWLDYTLAARRMAKILYQKVSGTWDESSEENNASEQ